MTSQSFDLDELWALQDAQGHDAQGHDLHVVVPAKNPEFGPYSDYRFVPAGGKAPGGWRYLTPDEIREAMEASEQESGD